jgi:uncharacterized protein (TIRG00374 family)
VLLLQSSLPAAATALARGLLVMALGVPALVVVGWRFRERVRAGVLRLTAALSRLTGRLSVEGVAERVDDLYEAFGRIAQDRAALVEAVAFAYLGWICFALPLYFAGVTLGFDAVDPLLVLFVVPASTLAGLTPSPGGLGGVEAALVALLVALTGLTAAQALAAALVYRVMSYWFALGVGGLAAVTVVARS